MRPALFNRRYEKQQGRGRVNDQIIALTSRNSVAAPSGARHSYLDSFEPAARSRIGVIRGRFATALFVETPFKLRTPARVEGKTRWCSAPPEISRDIAPFRGRGIFSLNSRRSIRLLFLLFHVKFSRHRPFFFFFFFFLAKRPQTLSAPCADPWPRTK